jgi:Tfp pilus assembly protein FimT
MLLDVVVAFAVIGLMLSIAWIGMAPRTGPQGLSAAAYEIEAMLRDARTAAERRAGDVSVMLDQPGRRLQAGGRTLELPRDSQTRLATSSCETARAIVFHADGTSCSVVLHLTTAAAALRIMVDGVTGDVRIVAP